ncbi:DnaA inactivator Hda [Corallincola platygyrae]|uniref:DnaA inactivator Hda n=1 Tax=Corallincola platygyrae TaxID=1193278 RepID=A0ABW4XSQ7_9GAMM
MTEFNQQLPLALNLPDDETFESFHTAGNEAAVAHLQNYLQESGRPIFVWGGEGAGKTHLLHAACANISQSGLQYAYLPMTQAGQLSPAMCDGLELVDLIAIDDIDKIAGQPEWERALFDLYNRVGEQGKARLVLSSSTSPVNGQFDLPDLVSRLNWGTVYMLSVLDDEQKIRMLMQRAKIRGMKMPDEVARFLLTRLDRDMVALNRALDQLDRASMVAQRRLTVPFVKQALSL